VIVRTGGVATLSRRQFLRGASVAGLGLLAGCGQLPGAAQDSVPRVYRLGYLGGSTGDPVSLRRHELFQQGLRAHGYVEGQNIIIERRYTEGRTERLPALAAELAGLPIDLIFIAGGTPAAVAAKEATSTIPIVVPAGDLVGPGLVASLARPGGNVTGLTTISPQLSGKRLQLLKEMIPDAVRVAMIWNPTNATSVVSLPEVQVAAEALGVALLPLEVRDSTDFEAAFEAAREHAEAVLVVGDPLFVPHAARMADLATRSRLPTMYSERAYAEAGALMAYGSNLDDQFRRAADYVDRILKGARPTDLPIEQPTTFDFVINLRTAQALGLTIPQHVLLQATEIIQ
jgi:putative tryptophan/tyrosine transport system substrate-binding protein